MLCRRFEPGDADPIARLFHDTVRTVNLGDYTQAQVKAWAPDEIHFRDWGAACLRCRTFVAEEAGRVLGYGQLEDNGHIDNFYVHHDQQGRGVGAALHAVIEAEARQLGIPWLFAEVSITARPFFTRIGYRVIRKQTVACRGQLFINYVMEKDLAGCAPESKSDS
jgi:putative acetyltransferase